MNKDDEFEIVLSGIVLIVLGLFILFLACCPTAHSQTIPASAQQQIQNAANAAHQQINAAQQQLAGYGNLPAIQSAIQSLNIGHQQINANVAPLLTPAATFVMPQTTIPVFTPPVIPPIILPMNTILPTDTILQYTLPNGYTSTIPVITQ